ncbi:MAG: 30S ribosomal protein S3 [Christensenellaceae bacterium]|jgi:small subunit ribosomal protein S3|nr:30S ribosomal protein S3 [Christensenellaceae bacterium]
MGQKVNPHGLRVGIIEDWNSKWFPSKKDTAKYILEDRQIRDYVKKEFYDAKVSKILITRIAGKVTVDVYSGMPAIALSKGSAIRETKKGKKKPELVAVNVAAEGEAVPGTEAPKKDETRGIDIMTREVTKICGNAVTVTINIREVRGVDTNAQLCAEEIAAQIQKRITVKRACKSVMQRTQRAGVKGVKVMVSGRIDGHEIAANIKFRDGSIPLQTLRAEIDYGFATAHTTYGVLGVKYWIYKGEVLRKKGGKN